MPWTSSPVARIAGRLRPPGDKSCSHRAMLFSALADGTSTVSGVLEGEDVIRSRLAVEALGASSEAMGPGQWRITGRGSLVSPEHPLDFGNSGTGSRLMMGVVAGYPIEAEFIGDVSLQSRPMGRVLNPLKEMGLEVLSSAEGDRLPARLRGQSNLQAISYTPPHASAQVKSAIMLAGLRANGTTEVIEPRITRDHTERMLRTYGVDISSEARGEGQIVRLAGGQSLSPVEHYAVPSDPSSAAFLMAAAMISPHGDVTLDDVMTNPTRTGFIEVVRGMADVTLTPIEGSADGAEPAAHITTRGTGVLSATDPAPELVPAMIDEFPIFAVLAAFAKGETHVTGAEELRVKESDRISAVVNMLRVSGVDCDETSDGFIVQGCDGPPPGGGLVETHHDHRIAMSALVMGTASQKPVAVDDVSMIATSYPEFFAHMASLGADIRQV